MSNAEHHQQNEPDELKNLPSGNASRPEVSGADKSGGEANHNHDGNGKIVLKRPPVSMVFWAVVLIGFVVLFLWRQSGGLPVANWDQSEFEKRLNHGDVVNAKVIPESDAVLAISGEYRLNEVERQKLESKLNRTVETAKFKTRVIKSDDLEKNFSKTQVTIRAKDTWTGNLLGMVLPFLLVAVIIYFLFARQIKAANGGAMQFGKSRARMVSPKDLNVHFSDVAGADEAKEEIQEIVEYLRDPLKFKLLGGKIPRGCLLVGPPGTGKTLLAKAVACEANVPFFSISGSDFVEMFVGVGASRVRDMFDHARRNSPCLIFIDEIDAVGRSRFSGMGGGHDEREQTLNAMLVEMDGLENRSDVIVLAATNRPDVLDSALLRPGRFDRQVVLDLPDIAGRRQILNVHAKNIRLDEAVNLDVVAQGTPGFSGADLANLCNEAALLAARNGEKSVTQQDMEEARDKVCWGRERRSRRITEHERKLIAYHEAGHALVGLHCENATPLHKVTIISRGQAYLGATFSLPKEDVYTRRKSELYDEMTSALGGRVAEELIFGDITTGASQDIEVVSRMARMMTCVYGMNDKIGPIKYGDFREHVHIRLDAPAQNSISEATIREIDLEVKNLIYSALDRARAILTEYRGDLEKLAQELLGKETLSSAEVHALLGYAFQEDDAAPAVDVPAEPAKDAASSDSTTPNAAGDAATPPPVAPTPEA